MLPWLRLVRFRVDLKFEREEEIKLARKHCKPDIEPRYNWHGWAAQSRRYHWRDIVPWAGGLSRALAATGGRLTVQTG